jgi:hypothetical protein
MGDLAQRFGSVLTFLLKLTLLAPRRNRRQEALVLEMLL